MSVDHTVLAARDLGALSELYERLGFTVTPRAQHPFGTGNQLVQLQGSFLELLSVTQPQDVPESGEGGFSFGAFNRDFLAAGEGMSMLALGSEGWEQDRARFEASGLEVFAPFGFGRKARLPDGKDVALDFRLTFIKGPAMPRASFFTCDHRHPPEVFWKPEYQSHANGARALAEITMVSECPEAHWDFLSRVFGAVVPIGGGICVGLAGAGLCVLEPDAFAETYPGARSPDLTNQEARFAGVRLLVSDLTEAEALWRDREIPFRRAGRRIYVSGENAFGTLICLSDG